MTTEAIHWLYHSLTKRETAEAVAAKVCDALGAAAPSGTKRVARAGTRQRFGWSSMSNRFRGADRMDKQVSKARDLAHAFLKQDLPDADDIVELDVFIDQTPHRLPPTPLNQHKEPRGARSCFDRTLPRYAL